MHHMGRTHGVSLTFLYDCIHSGQVDHGYIKTQNMYADVFTKFFSDKKAAEWVSVRNNVAVYAPTYGEQPAEWKARFGNPGHGHVEALRHGGKQ